MKKNGAQWATGPCKENSSLSQFIFCKILLATDGGVEGMGCRSRWEVHMKLLLFKVTCSLFFAI